MARDSPRCSLRSRNPASIRASEPNGGVLISPLSQASGLSRGLIQIEYMSDMTYRQIPTPTGNSAATEPVDSKRRRRDVAVSKMSPRRRSIREHASEQWKRTSESISRSGPNLNTRRRASSPTCENIAKWVRVPSTPPFFARLFVCGMSDIALRSAQWWAHVVGAPRLHSHKH
jgi:hypothetical protein